MATFSRPYRIRRPADHVFDVIGTHLFENHPRWEREVIAIRPITEGPVRVGSRAVMVREEYGRRSESVYEITAFEQGRRLTARHVDGPMDFELTFEVAPVDAMTSELTLTVKMAFRGRFRILSPLLGLQLPGRSDRITRSMIALVEGMPSTLMASPSVG